jgi:hypothetical protein
MVLGAIHFLNLYVFPIACGGEGRRICGRRFVRREIQVQQEA